MKSEFSEEKAELESQKSTLESRLTALRTERDDYKKRMTVECQAAMDEMKGILEKENASMKKELQRRNDDLHEELHNMRDQHIQEMRGKDQEIEDVKNNNKQETEKKRMEEEYVAKRIKLEQEKEEELRSLKDENQALKGAMVKRDHFKAMSERELALRFKDLASEIDGFSRVPWDNKQEVTWPFPEKVLRKSDNESNTSFRIPYGSFSTRGSFARHSGSLELQGRQ
jgi:hypothetical protein